MHALCLLCSGGVGACGAPAEALPRLHLGACLHPSFSGGACRPAPSTLPSSSLSGSGSSSSSSSSVARRLLGQPTSSATASPAGPRRAASWSGAAGAATKAPSCASAAHAAGCSTARWLASVSRAAGRAPARRFWLARSKLLCRLLGGQRFPFWRRCSPQAIARPAAQASTGGRGTNSSVQGLQLGRSTAEEPGLRRSCAAEAGWHTKEPRRRAGHCSSRCSRLSAA